MATALSPPSADGFGATPQVETCPADFENHAIDFKDDDGSNFTLRVLTQNAWCLPVVSYRMKSRIAGICAMLSADPCDIIAFQEVWHPYDRDTLREAGRAAGLPFSRDFKAGIGIPINPNLGGTGMLILSRYPIVDTAFRRFSVNGKPVKFHHADYYGAKGVGLVRVQTPRMGLVDVYTTHLHAAYSKTADEYYSTRVAQAVEMARFVALTRRAPLVLAIGDFNAVTGDLCHAILNQVAGLRDSFAELHPGKPGYTYGLPDNKLGDDVPERLDYILFSGSILPPPPCTPTTATSPTASAGSQRSGSSSAGGDDSSEVGFGLTGGAATTATLSPLPPPPAAADGGETVWTLGCSRVFKRFMDESWAPTAQSKSPALYESLSDGRMPVSDHFGLYAEFSLSPRDRVAAAVAGGEAAAATAAAAEGKGDEGASGTAGDARAFTIQIAAADDESNSADLQPGTPVKALRSQQPSASFSSAAAAAPAVPSLSPPPRRCLWHVVQEELRGGVMEVAGRTGCHRWKFRLSLLLCLLLPLVDLAVGRAGWWTIAAGFAVLPFAVYSATQFFLSAYSTRDEFTGLQELLAEVDVLAADYCARHAHSHPGTHHRNRQSFQH